MGAMTRIPECHLCISGGPFARDVPRITRMIAVNYLHEDDSERAVFLCPVCDCGEITTLIDSRRV